MDLYQGCSYDDPGVKLAPAPGVTSLKQEQRRKTLKFFFSETRRSRALIIWPWTMIFGPISILFKTGPILGVISWNNSNREGRIHFVGKLTQVSASGPSWPFCSIYDRFKQRQPCACGVRACICKCFSLKNFSETIDRIFTEFHRSVP